MATIKLNGVDTTLNPIGGTPSNDKLTASGETTDGVFARLGDGKDLFRATAEFDAFEAVENNMSVNGGAGKDRFRAEDGLVTITGKLNTSDDEDTISVARADGAELQGGKNADEVSVGSAVELDVAGSRADTTIKDSEVLGGNGADTVSTLEFAKLSNSNVVGGGGHDTMSIDGVIEGESEILESSDSAGNSVISADSMIKGGLGRDTITIEDGATLINTLVIGNANADEITIGEDGRGALGTDSEGNYVSGGAGNDEISVAKAGQDAIGTVKGGSGDDMLRVGGGQIVTGGLGIDTFSIEGEGGVTITDYNAKQDLTTGEGEENCYCSDAIQIDGNKIHYTSKAYEHTVAVNTTASSYTGVVKVKAVAEAVQDTDNCGIPFDGIKIEGLTATAVAFGYAIGGDSPAATFPGNEKFAIQYPDFGFVNSDVDGNARGSRSNPIVPNGMNALATAEGPYLGSQGSLLTRLSNSPIPNPLATALRSKLDGIGFGFASAEGILINQQGIVASFVNDIVATTYTSFKAGQFSFLGLTRNCGVTANVQQVLTFNDVSNATIKNHSAVYGVAKSTEKYSLYSMQLGTNQFTEVTVGTAYMKVTKNLEDKTYLKTSKTLNGGFLIDFDAGTANAVLTLNGAFSYAYVTPDATVNDPRIGQGTPSFPSWVSVPGGFNSADPAWQAAKKLTVNATLPQQVAGNPLDRLFDTRTAFDQRYLAVKVEAAGNTTVNAYLPTFVERRTFEAGDLGLKTCPSFPSPNTLSERQGSQHGDVVGSNFAKSLIWTTGEATSIANQLASTFFSSTELPKLCTSGGINSCSTGESYTILVKSKSNQPLSDASNASTVLNALQQGAFFSGSDWNVDVLAAAGMGDGLSASQEDAQGAPFRVLFFDTEGDDKGLYMYSGLANYDGTTVTGIANTGGTVSSAMGGKHTIVKVTGGKGAENFSLSDITFV